jgi:hypothetical protein
MRPAQELAVRTRQGFHGAIISLPLPLAANSEFRNSGVHGHLPPGAT